jgi:putative photosynthetic complex assembly protein
MAEIAKPCPPKVLFAAAALIVLTIGSAAIAKWTGLGASRTPQSAAAEVRQLRFEDRNDGSIAIIQATDGRLVETLDPGTNGFVRIVMRSLARERRMHDHGPDVPFNLVRWADGRLTVEDPTTQRRIDLGAFGAVNTQSFARLMNAGVQAQ